MDVSNAAVVDRSRQIKLKAEQAVLIRLSHSLPLAYRRRSDVAHLTKQRQGHLRERLAFLKDAARLKLIIHFRSNRCNKLALDIIEASIEEGAH